MTNKLNLEFDVAYKVNPAFDEWDTDVYYLYEETEDGAFFHRFVNGVEVEEHGYFSKYNMNDGVLVEA